MLEQEVTETTEKYPLFPSCPNKGQGKSQSTQRVLHQLQRLSRFLLVVYAFLCIGMMALEGYLVYPIPNSTPTSSSNPTIEDIHIVTEDGIKLHGLYFSHPNPQYRILYCHGNGEDVSHNRNFVAKLRDSLQASILLFDYRGYGKSEGAPFEAGLIQDGLVAQTWLAKRTNCLPHDIVLWGRSLGGGIAVAIAQQQGARALILQNTFHDMTEVAASKFPWLPVRWIMRNRFPSIERIQQYQGPLLQCHGTADQVIPYPMGQKLFKAATSQEKMFLKIVHGGHNDPAPAAFLEALPEFLKTLPERSGDH